jgi:CubicO group peptidase (beta-lactamase class C family)
MATLTWMLCALILATMAGSAGAPPAPSTTLEAVLYTDPKPEQFMTRWLVCGPFPVVDRDGAPVDEEAQKRAFDVDFLTEHGGEAQIRPAPGMSHHRDGSEYRWQPITSAKESVDLVEIYGKKQQVVAYAWAEIETAAPKTVLLGIGSDDAVKVWLNGEPIHANWTFRPLQRDQDVVVAHLLPGKNQLLLKVQNGDGEWGFACRLLAPDREAASRMLLTAAAENRKAVAEFLLAHGADVHTRDGAGRTPLHLAAERGHPEMARLLLANGADVNATTPDRLTALHLARRAGYRDLAALLIARGADIRRRPAARSVQVDTLLHALDGTPGAAVVVVQDGKIVHRKGYGLADLETKAPVRPDTPFYLASVSKQFTAMAIMLLAEQGKLSYDDPLRNFFPDFPAFGNGITLRHLLYHTSGIPDYLNDRLVEDATDFTNARVLDLVEHLKELKFPPGERYSYSNSGYILLAMTAARVSGQPFHRFMQERVFGPLGMKHTRVYDESKPVIPDRARGYSREGDAFKLNDYHLLTAGDGGTFSTAEDLARWDRCLYTEKLVKAATLQQAFTRGKLNDGKEFDYGFGWSVGTFRGLRTVSHGGGLGGFRTFILRFPDQRFSVIVLSNNGTFNSGATSYQIAEIYLADRMAPREPASAGR